jgi:hypothetical protein
VLTLGILGHAIHARDFQVKSVAFRLGVRHIGDFHFVNVIKVNYQPRHVGELARTLGALEMFGHLVLDQHILILKLAITVVTPRLAIIFFLFATHFNGDSEEKGPVSKNENKPHAHTQITTNTHTR